MPERSEGTEAADPANKDEEVAIRSHSGQPVSFPLFSLGHIQDIVLDLLDGFLIGAVCITGLKNAGTLIFEDQAIMDGVHPANCDFNHPFWGNVSLAVAP